MVDYINTSISLFTSFSDGLKGAAQLGVGILDQSVNPANGVTEMGALAIMLAFVGFVLSGILVVINRGKKVVGIKK